MKYFKKTFIHILFILLAYSSLYSQETSEDTIRVETSLVVVPTRVVDSEGRFIPNLKKENFQLLENGKTEEIIGFETDNAPFTVALMLDVSDSTKFKLKEIQDAATAFLKQLRPQDQAIVFSFDRNIIKVFEGNLNSLSELKDSIRLTQTGGGTSLYDSVDVVVNNYLKKINQRKKAIVLFTDGIDTTSKENYLRSLHTAQESNALIYSIQYDTVNNQQEATNSVQIQMVTAKGEPLPTAYKRGTQYLNLLSSNSGGRSYFANTVENLTKVFSQIANELSQQYVLSYYPQNQNADDKKRSIKVSVDMKNAKIKARKTYIFNSKN